MKKTVASIVAIVGGIWTAIFGILFAGSLLSMMTDKDTAPPTDQIVKLGIIMVVGIGVLAVGLNMMKGPKKATPRN